MFFNFLIEFWKAEIFASNLDAEQDSFGNY